jgi:hypothetical protein
MAGRARRLRHCQSGFDLLILGVPFSLLESPIL